MKDTDTGAIACFSGDLGDLPEWGNMAVLSGKAPQQTVITTDAQRRTSARSGKPSFPRILPFVHVSSEANPSTVFSSQMRKVRCKQVK